MKPPLAILGRRSGAILLREGGHPGLPTPGFEGKALTFSSLRDADAYLLFWTGDHGAMSSLRHALHEIGHSRDVSRCSDDEVVHALAVRLVEGSLEMLERDVPRAYLDVAAAFRRAAATRPAATPSGAVVRPEVPAVVPPVVPPAEVLPLLEKVQIEGAEVLPEVLQTLEQIDVSLGSLDLASVSLEPTPSAVPSISDAMTEASASVTTTIDDL